MLPNAPTENNKGKFNQQLPPKLSTLKLRQNFLPSVLTAHQNSTHSASQTAHRTALTSHCQRCMSRMLEMQHLHPCWNRQSIGLLGLVCHVHLSRVSEQRLVGLVLEAAHDEDDERYIFITRQRGLSGRCRSPHCRSPHTEAALPEAL